MRGKVALIVGLLSSPLVATASSVTYDFTGTVTSAQGIYGSIADGTKVTGTYTIDLSNAGVHSTGTFGSSTSLWTALEESGANLGTLPSSAYVFSSTASVAGFSYTTSGPGTAVSESFVQNAGGPNTYTGQETQQTDAVTFTQSTFGILNTNGTAPYSSAGLPVFSAVTSGSGSFTSKSLGVTSSVSYQLTGLTPVPLPTSIWLLVSALGGLAALAPRKLAA
jgi:hypothetical protein